MSSEARIGLSFFWGFGVCLEAHASSANAAEATAASAGSAAEYCAAGKQGGHRCGYTYSA
jgi:hypothetical protein